MSLADKLNSARRPAPKSLDRIVEDLSAEDAAALKAAATDPEISTAALLRALQSEGYAIGKQTLADWRRAHGFTR